MFDVDLNEKLATALHLYEQALQTASTQPVEAYVYEQIVQETIPAQLLRELCDHFNRRLLEIDTARLDSALQQDSLADERMITQQLLQLVCDWEQALTIVTIHTNWTNSSRRSPQHIVQPAWHRAL
jgi:hypothetical protein